MRPSALLTVIACCLALCPATARSDDGPDIFAAARLGDLTRVTELLDAEPELANVLSAAHETPLHYALLGRNGAVVDLLLARGADANAADSTGRRPLHVAAHLDQPKPIAALLAAGADVNATDYYGETALHVAARHFKAGALQALLAAGADVQARNSQGQTPLHVLGSAARVRDAEFGRLIASLASLLIEHGADPGIIADGLPALRPAPQKQPAGAGDDYRTYAEILEFLEDRAAAYPSLCQYHDIGQSVQGRYLRVLNITDNPGVDEDEPEFKYVSTMHGDETVGNEMCLFFIDHLLTNYGSDPDITNYVNEMDIWIMPLMNPDGYVNGTRYNAHGVDLNRHFPEGSDGEPNTTDGKEPEVAAIMEWTWQHSFTQSANFHTGALVVNYPFDDDNKGSTFSPTPDEDLFVEISEAYSYYNTPMWNGSFYHGITNGAAWYSISGGMQDWHYRYEGCNEVTIELSNVKDPPYSQIPGFWDDNRQSMLSYMSKCLIGVRGILTDVETGLPVAATVTVVGRDHEIYSDPDVGDYHRMLLPGTYTLRLEARGYDPVEVSDVVVNSGDATRLDMQMGPAARVTYPNGGEQLVSGVTTDVTWTGGNPTAQFHVQYTDNYGQSSVVTDDFEDGSLGPEYSTGGDADWFVTTSSYHSPFYSARAGAISHNDESWLTRSVDGGDLAFWYRVSSESGYDFFNFYVDGDRQLHVSGESGWQPFSTTLPAGPHELKWEYVKDYSVSNGSDTAWIDDLEVVDDQTAWTDIIALTDPGATSTPWTPGAAGTDYKVRVRAYYGGSSYGDWDESDATFEVIGYALGDLNCDGAVDAFDIDPFVLALTDPAGYADAYPLCDRMLADCNQDDTVNAFDIDPFVQILTGK